MSATLSIYGRQQLLNAVFAPDLYTAPSAMAIALLYQVAGLNDTGASIVEPPASIGYQRTEVGLSSGFWTPTGFGEVGLLDYFLHPAFSADGTLVAGYALVDSVTIGDGNLWVVGTMPEQLQIQASVPLELGDLVVGLYD